MTIVVGFRCSNGVVIATDSQYSLDISKTRGQKIFPIPTNGYYALTIGGAGGSDQIKWAVSEIQHSLAKEIGARHTSSTEIREIVESVLIRSYRDHVNPAPEEEGNFLEYGLLIGIWTAKERSLLFRSSRTTLAQVENPNYTTIGQGSCLSAYILHALFERTWLLTVDEASSVGAYIVQMAKEFVDFCGGSTFVRVLDENGHDVRLGKDEVENAIEHYRELFRWTSSIRSLLDQSIDPASVEMLPYANILRDQIIKFRALQDKRRSFSDDLIGKHGIKPVQ
jgi:20S proteasome alpha/beta subunit